MSTTVCLTKAARVTKRAEQILDGIGIMANPYLTTLTDGSMPLERFRATRSSSASPSPTSPGRWPH